jgi:RHS repeat-associated protein
MRTATPISDCVLEPRDRIGLRATLMTKCSGSAYRARYYDPIRSRFVGEDPLGLAAGINRYVYTFNSPLSWVDRTGLDVTVIHYTGASDSPAGHIGISVNDGPSIGFDPVWWSLPWVPFGYPVPGTVDTVAPNRGVRDQITIRWQHG